MPSGCGKNVFKRGRETGTKFGCREDWGGKSIAGKACKVGKVGGF